MAMAFLQKPVGLCGAQRVVTDAVLVRRPTRSSPKAVVNGGRRALCARVVVDARYSAGTRSPPVCPDTTSDIYCQDYGEPCHDLLHPWLIGVKAHESSVTAGVLVEDPSSGSKLFVSASMDKTVAAWRWDIGLTSTSEEEEEAEDFDQAAPSVEVQKIMAPGGPIFSLVQAPPHEGNEKCTDSHKPQRPQILMFCGNAAKEVVAWEPFCPEFQELKLGEHTGWVRSLAMSGKYLFSCGCNFLRQWDTTYMVPKEVASIRLFTGDILAVAADKSTVFTAGADGSLHSWRIDKQSGHLEEGPKLAHAHDGRVHTILVHKNMLFSAGADGHIKAWNKQTLEPCGQALDAHSGEKVQCMSLAPGGILISGGDDQMIRAWDTASLATSQQLGPANSCHLPPFHNSAVRMLVAGADFLISGDSEGYLSFWRYGSAVEEAVKAELDAKTKAAEAARIEATLKQLEAEASLFEVGSSCEDEESCLTVTETPVMQLQLEARPDVVSVSTQSEL